MHWPFDDPAAVEGSEQAKLDKFREVRDAIDLRIRDWALEFKQKQASIQV